MHEWQIWQKKKKRNSKRLYTNRESATSCYWRRMYIPPIKDAARDLARLFGATWSRYVLLFHWWPFFVYAARCEASEKRAVRNGLPHTLSLKNAKRGENVCVCCVVVLVA